MPGRPYIYWDPSYNADLWTRTADGPLLVAMDDEPTPAQIETYKKLVSLTARPVLFDGPHLHYAHQVNVEGGEAPSKGLRVYNYEWMPENLSFSALGPDPLDLSNTYEGEQFRYINLGWRFTLRGWASTMYSGAMSGECRVKWASEQIREQYSTDAAWTGLTLSVTNTTARRFDHVLDMLHGKREADTDWQYHGGWLDRNPTGEVVNENTIVANDIDGSNVRIVVSGGAPSWNVTEQYEDDATWYSANEFAIDLRSHVEPEDLDGVGIVASAFMGIGKTLPGLPPAWPESSVWFSEFELSQFEPWIPDVAYWSERDWDEHWRWLAGAVTEYDVELRRPVTDLLHVPLGAARAPVELRHSDADMGICTKLGFDTNLFAVGNSDDRYAEISESAPPQPLAVCDQQSYGRDAPFAVYMRLKLEDIGSWSTLPKKNIISFGDIHNELQTENDNGIGIYYQYFRGSRVLTCVYYSNGKKYLRTDDLPFLDWSDELLDVGFAWTGARGVSIGRPNYELRIIVNGITRATAIVPNMTIAGTTTAQLGAMGETEGIRGLIRSVAVFCDPMTDYDLSKAFEGTRQPFCNPSYELPSDTGRPGEAKCWSWVSLQTGWEWAEFNAQEQNKDKWRTAMEEFGPGWNDLENWQDNIADADVLITMFNSGVTAYESTTENFSLWSVWNGSGWSAGTPWRDDWVEIQPYEDTLGGGGGPTGFDGWYDNNYGTNVLPLELEEFGEAWQNDPFSAPGWYPGIIMNGVVTGSALTFPVSIPPDKRLLTVYTEEHGVTPMELTVGEYGDAVDLAAMVQGIWEAHVGAGGLVFSAWDAGATSGIRFGWDGVTPGTHASMFGHLGAQKYNDARELLGLVGFGPDGITTGIQCRAWMLDASPEIGANDLVVLDSWSFAEFTVVSDTYNGTYANEYALNAAVFDTAISDPTVVERFALKGWFGIDAEWKTDYLPAELSNAMFDSETTDIEEFLPAEWPDELWT